MKPAALQRWLASPAADGVRIGVEFEMIIPDVAVDENFGDYDFDQDEPARDINDIVNFFSNDEQGNGVYNPDRLESQLREAYLDWLLGEALENHMDRYADDIAGEVRERLEYEAAENYKDEAEEMAREELEFDADQELSDSEQEQVDDLIPDKLNVLVELWIDEQTREWDSAYDDVRQEWEQDFVNSADLETEWLEDMGATTMYSAMQEFSIDTWPFFETAGSTELEEVADRLSAAIGMPVDYSTEYHGKEKIENEWMIEPDSSISADSSTDGGLEIVSPPMPIKEGLAAIEKMFKWARSVGAYTNNTTGLHINVSVPGFDLEQLDFVKLALMIGDQYVLKTFQRQANRYAKSAVDVISSKLTGDTGTEVIERAMAAVRQQLNTAASKIIHSGSTGKFTSINPKEDRVEFRGPGGDYLNQDLSDIFNTVIRLAMGLHIATNEDLYKKEYAKKLYKLIAGVNTKELSTLDLFARYQAGAITLDQLKRRWADAVLQKPGAKKPAAEPAEDSAWEVYDIGSGRTRQVFPNRIQAQQYANDSALRYSLDIRPVEVPATKKAEIAQRIQQQPGS